MTQWEEILGSLLQKDLGKVGHNPGKGGTVSETVGLGPEELVPNIKNVSGGREINAYM